MTHPLSPTAPTPNSNAHLGSMQAMGRTVLLQLLLQIALATESPLTSLPVRGTDGFARRRRKADTSKYEAELAAEIGRRPHMATPLVDRADFFASQRRFTEAAKDYAEALKMDPGCHLCWANAAVALLEAGDLEGYRRYCAEMVKRFGGSSNRNVCERVVRTCTMLPDSVADLKPVRSMADRAVAPDDVNGGAYMRTWTALAKGMAEYRAGNFESAAQWLQKAIPAMESSGQSTAYFFLAMTQSKRGRGPDAEAALAKGNQLYKRDGPHGDNFSANYRDWIIALHSRNEAAALLGHPLDSPATQPGR